MAKRIINCTKTFRDRFTVSNKDIMKWFPGHMHKGMNQILSTLKDVDCVVEVHDARIPFSGRNPRFRDIIQLRPHILVLNKIDLADLTYQERVVNKLRQQGVDKVLFTNGLEARSPVISKELFPSVLELVSHKSRYHRQDLNEYNVMVIGVPNVGKSTFINAIRRLHTLKKKKVAQVGAIAGVTRSVGSRIRVSFEPSMFVIDTPGILTPSVSDVESGMRLALCSCLPDHLVGEDNIVDYMLYWLNKRKEFGYVDYFGLTEPTEDVTAFLAHVAMKEHKVKKVKSVDNVAGGYVYTPDFIIAAKLVLKAFRTGQFGKFVLDDDKLGTQQYVDISRRGKF